MIRGVLYVIWMALSIIPLALAIVILSPFVKGRPLYWIAQLWLRQMTGFAHWICGIKYEVYGLENLPSAESLDPVILCPKHQSTWETFALPAMMSHPLAYVFKKELLKVPFFGWSIGALDMIHIDRAQRSRAFHKVVEQGKRLLDQGIWVIMFPEGTRVNRGEVGEYKTGATRLAIMTGAPVVPIAVTSAKCWPRKAFIKKPGVVDVSIGKPISSVGRKHDELMVEVEAWIESEMQRLDPEAYRK